ncbi:MAG: VOC family protein [bacterium]
MAIAHSALAALALPSFDDVLPAAFRRDLGLDPATQYGVACRDVPRAIADAEALGGGPFLRARVSPPHWTERGVRRRAHLDFALGYCDDVQLEFLGPGKGTRFYADALGDADTILHHVGVYQRGLASLTERLERAGHVTVVSGGVRLGPLARFQFRYFDTRAALGIYLEILDFAWLGDHPIPMRPFIERAARLRSPRFRAAPR